MKIRESGEMYLEYIWTLQQQKGVVRAIDVSLISGYSKPSVSRALGLLKSAGYVTVDGASGNITLTQNGLTLARKIAERHRILSSFLQLIGVAEETAGADACKLEHVISDETFEKLKAFVANSKK